MSNEFQSPSFLSGLSAVTGGQAYFFEVPSANNALSLSVVSMEIAERIGQPTEAQA